MRDFKADLLEQMDFLQASAERFDSGHEHEAKRMATVVRVLLYEKGQTPLLREMNLREEVDWLSLGSAFEAGNLAVTNSLVSMRMSFPAGASFESHATIPGQPLPWAHWREFDSWWSGDPVIHNPQSGLSFSRRNLILMLANRDGGAHVGRLSKEEQVLASGQATSWAADFGHGVVDVMDSPVPASVRTIAAEVIATITRNREKLDI